MVLMTPCRNDFWNALDLPLAVRGAMGFQVRFQLLDWDTTGKLSESHIGKREAMTLLALRLNTVPKLASMSFTENP